VPGIFRDTPPERALGPERKVMCIDYSVGKRSEERKAHSAQKITSGSTVKFNGCLAALRVPEWELVFDDGRPGLQVEVG